MEKMTVPQLEAELQRRGVEHVEIRVEKNWTRLRVYLSQSAKSQRKFHSVQGSSLSEAFSVLVRTLDEAPNAA